MVAKNMSAMHTAAKENRIPLARGNCALLFFQLILMINGLDATFLDELRNFITDCEKPHLHKHLFDYQRSGSRLPLGWFRIIATQTFPRRA